MSFTYLSASKTVGSTVGTPVGISVTGSTVGADVVGAVVGVNGGVSSLDGSAVMIVEGAGGTDAGVGTATGAEIVGTRSVGALVGLRVTGGIVGRGEGTEPDRRVNPRLNPTASSITMIKDKQAHPRAKSLT